MALKSKELAHFLGEKNRNGLQRRTLKMVSALASKSEVYNLTRLSFQVLSFFTRLTESSADLSYII